jgi:hypothetical protein
MNGEQLLGMRVAEQRAQLTRIKACLDTAPLELTPMLRSSLDKKLRDCLSEFDEVRREARLGVGTAWLSYGHAVSYADRLRNEVFCFVAGAMLRRDGIDEGVGRVAELLLDELAGRSGLANRLMTTLSFTTEEESLDRTINLVRLRFPGAGVWDLPVVAHEFGHYLLRECPAVRDDLERPFASLVAGPIDSGGLLDDKGVIPDAEHAAARIEELFADVCATYALGPAYPLAAAAFRVPHLALDMDSPTHPRWRYRIAVMVGTLRWMAHETGSHGLVVDRWVRPLLAALPGSDAGESVSPVAANSTERLVDRMARELTRHAGGLRYGMDDTPDRVAAELARGSAVVNARLPAGCTIAHVLDGAWRWRLSHPDVNSTADLAAVNATVVGLCKRIGTRRRGGGDVT